MPPPGKPEQVLIVEAKRPGAARGAARQQVHHRKRGQRLPAPRFPDQAMGLPARKRERDAAHRLGRRAEADAERLDLEDRAHPARATASRSLSPSPSRLMPSTSTKSARPGIMITQGLKNM